MTKKDKLIWRLKEQPTAESLRDLVSTGILTKEEAREILLSTETTEDRDKKSLESEIKFLRELVDRLANKQVDRIVETIKYVEKPYYRYDWYQPYLYYCSTTGSGATLTAGGVATSGGSTHNLLTVNTSAAQDFTSIKTF